MLNNLKWSSKKDSDPFKTTCSDKAIFPESIPASNQSIVLPIYANSLIIKTPICAIRSSFYYMEKFQYEDLKFFHIFGFL